MLATSVTAQLHEPPAATDRSAGAPYRVRQTTESIKLDGVFDERAWLDADSIVEMRQREPVEGAPATERTVAKLVRDATRLYIAVRAYDSNMSAVRSAQLRRDANLSSDDNIKILVDSYRDRRSAFLFGTNPSGAMWDAQITGFDNVNDNWNGIWEVVTRRDSSSWSAEFAIPLQTLRFRPGADVIGVNVRRFIRRKNEEDLWKSWGRAEGLDNLLYSGDAAGFQDVERARPIELRPYMLGRVVSPAYDVLGQRTASGASGGRAGIDAKLAVSPTMTADLTVNTDFAQVESDEQVINLTRFPLFFPEKREFFLESSGLFDIGTPGRVQLFYSRRIGLSSAGAPVPILGGARLYGKAGPWAIGFLDARTGGRENANDLVVRVSHDLFARSTIAGLLTDRSGPGVQGIQRAAGADLDLPLIMRGHNIEPHFWIMGTRTLAVGGTPLAWRVSTDYPNALFDNFVSLYRIDSGFDPILGFVRRTGIWETTGHIDYMPRPKVLGIRQLDLTPIPRWDIIADRSGNLTDALTWQTADFESHLLAGDLESGDHFELNLTRELDAPDNAFEIFRGVSIAPGRYWWTTGDVQYESSAGRPISVGAVLSTGHFYDGHSKTAELSGTYRGGGHLILSLGHSVTAAQLSGGRFTAIQSIARLEYAFTTRATFMGFAQFQNDERRADFNLRFHWIPKIGDDFFVVWNSGFTTDPSAPFRFPRRRALTHPLNGAIVIKGVHYIGY